MTQLPSSILTFDQVPLFRAQNIDDIFGLHSFIASGRHGKSSTISRIIKDIKIPIGSVRIFSSDHQSITDRIKASIGNEVEVTVAPILTSVHVDNIFSKQIKRKHSDSDSDEVKPKLDAMVVVIHCDRAISRESTTIEQIIRLCEDAERRRLIIFTTHSLSIPIPLNLCAKFVYMMSSSQRQVENVYYQHVASTKVTSISNYQRLVHSIRKFASYSWVVHNCTTKEIYRLHPPLSLLKVEPKSEENVPSSSSWNPITAVWNGLSYAGSFIW